MITLFRRKGAGRIASGEGEEGRKEREEKGDRQTVQQLLHQFKRITSPLYTVLADMMATNPNHHTNRICPMELKITPPLNEM